MEITRRNFLKFLGIGSVGASIIPIALRTKPKEDIDLSKMEVEEWTDYDRITLTPKRVGGFIKISKELLKRATLKLK